MVAIDGKSARLVLYEDMDGLGEAAGGDGDATLHHLVESALLLEEIVDRICSQVRDRVLHSESA